MGWVAPLALVGSWQVSVSSGVLDYQFLPAPTEIAGALRSSGELPTDVIGTLGVSVLATMIALVVGGGVGLVVGLVPALHGYTAASIDFLRTIPAVALMPVALLALGVGPHTGLLLAVYAACWPLVLNTAGGVAAVPPRLREVARTLRLSPAATAYKVVLPAVVPAWLVGARLSAIIALHVTIITQMLITGTGLGGGLIAALHGLNPTRMWVYALTCGALGYLLNATLRHAVRLALPGSTANRVPAGAT
jgi:ABC-type nitrate/sulfonate/bicarbonate transport system permease component